MKKYLLFSFLLHIALIVELYAPQILTIKNSRSENKIENNKTENNSMHQKNVALPVEIPLGVKAYIENMQPKTSSPIVTTTSAIHPVTGEKFGTIKTESYKDSNLNIDYLVHDNESLKPTIKLTEKNGTEKIIQVGTVQKPFWGGKKILDDSYTIKTVDKDKVEFRTYDSDGREVFTSKLYNFVTAAEQTILKLKSQAIEKIRLIIKMPLSEERNYEIEKVGFDLVDQASTQLGVLLSFQEKKNIVDNLVVNADHLNENIFVSWVSSFFCKIIEVKIYISSGSIAKAAVNLNTSDISIQSVDKNGLISKQTITGEFNKTVYFDFQGKHEVSAITVYKKNPEILLEKIFWTYDTNGNILDREIIVLNKEYETVKKENTFYDYDEKGNLLKEEIILLDEQDRYLSKVVNNYSKNKISSVVKYNYEDSTIILSDNISQNNIKIEPVNKDNENNENIEDNNEFSLTYKNKKVTINFNLYLYLLKETIHKKNDTVNSKINEFTKKIFLNTLGVKEDSVLMRLFLESEFNNNVLSDLSAKINIIKESYSQLGLSESSTIDLVRSNYKKNALRLHPDKNSSLQAKKEFQELQLAKDFVLDYLTDINLYENQIKKLLQLQGGEKSSQTDGFIHDNKGFSQERFKFMPKAKLDSMLGFETSASSDATLKSELIELD